jgi:hypothetical protein
MHLQLLVSSREILTFDAVLLVVIVPQLVPLKYVSTTLGAHKSVSNTIRRYDNSLIPRFQLEQTGSVIMQTLAGLALDTKHQPSPGKNIPDVPSRDGLAAIQYLLNAFVLLNVFQFLVLMTLAHLDRRRKAAVATVADFYGSSGELITDDHNEDPLDSPNNLEGAEGSICLSLSARGRPVPSAASPEESRPLLVSDAESSLFATDAAEPNSSPPVTPGDPPKTNQVKRGELFAGLSAALVVFAWVLFLVTAWLRLRSKAEREAATIAS